VGGGGCAGQLVGSGNSPRWHNTSDGGMAGFDGGGGSPAGSAGSVVGLRCEEVEGGVRMNQSAKEETGARVRLTGGRGGGSISDQILW
jgi:hypothetical protein